MKCRILIFATWILFSFTQSQEISGGEIGALYLSPGELLHLLVKDPHNDHSVHCDCFPKSPIMGIEFQKEVSKSPLGIVVDSEGRLNINDVDKYTATRLKEILLSRVYTRKVKFPLSESITLEARIIKDLGFGGQGDRYIPGLGFNWEIFAAPPLTCLVIEPSP